MAVSLAIFSYGIWRRIRLWRKGVAISGFNFFVSRVQGFQKEIWQKVKPRLQRVMVEGLGQKRVRGRGLASWAHGTLFIGFVILFVGTTLLEIDNITSAISSSFHFHRGIYYVIYEFSLDIFGIIFLIGCVLFAWRRTRPPSSLGHKWSDWFILILFVSLGLTGFIVEALRIKWQEPPFEGAICSPVGYFLSLGLPLNIAQARSLHWGFWWVHAFMAFTFIAMIPYTRLMHLITGTLNIFFAKPELGRLDPITLQHMEKSNRVGVSQITDFTQTQLLSLDACMECGRCEEACPAFATHKPLSPKEVVQDLKLAMGIAQNLHENVIQAETLWACTSCSACVDVCPVRIDPLTMIFDMRRNLVGESALSGTAATTLRRMQSSGNPWGFPATERMNWASELHVPTCKENPNFEVLYWIGCAGSYDRRAQRVTRAVIKLLQHAKVNFAILGREEKCNGESARRVGDEFLFQELAVNNIATLSKYKVRKILAHCPHCLNTFLKDYPQFGGNYEVLHHTQFLEQLQKEGKLSMATTKNKINNGAITYHDPCYLARVNNIHESPREVLHSLMESSSKTEIREMARNRAKTFCCGAGGGRMWMEEDPKQRVSTLRAKEALATGAKTVAVGCPFCLTMMSDGVAAEDSTAKVMDVAELLAEQLGL